MGEGGILDISMTAGGDPTSLKKIDLGNLITITNNRTWTLS